MQPEYHPVHILLTSCLPQPPSFVLCSHHRAMELNIELSARHKIRGGSVGGWEVVK